MKTTFLGLLFSLLFVSNSYAESNVPVHGFTPEESRFMALSNEKTASRDFLSGLFGNINKNTNAISVLSTEVLPFAEYGTAGYLIISDQVTFNSLEVKRQLAKNLPQGMTLVIFTGIKNAKTPQTIIDAMAPYISKDRIKVIYLPTGKRGFWARDGVPVPTYHADPGGLKNFAVVDAKYYHEFEADQEVANYFGAELVKHDYYHEGGNFLTNALGDCVIVDNERAIKIPADVFEKLYGCKTLIRLPHIKGIGHVDESVKFVNDDTLLVDNDRYEKTLKAAGFKTIRLPRPSNEYETYVNSLVLNGTVFIPVFNQATDAAAVKTYADLGLKTIPLNSTSLSNDGLGSIHCITMVYPNVPWQDLLQATGATEIK